MKRHFSIAIIAMIVLSLVIIPIGGVPAAKAATKTPGKARVPGLVQLRPWDGTIWLDSVYIPKNTKNFQFYLRTTGKYVKTVKLNSRAYRKYKKNTKKYIVVKDKRTQKKYRVYKATKWKRILTTGKVSDYYRVDGPYAPKVKLMDRAVYQLKVRGKNGKKVGKFSRILQFRTPSKKVREEYVERYELDEEFKGEIAFDTAIDENATDEDKESTMAEYKLVPINDAYTVYVSSDPVDMPVAEDPEYEPKYIPANFNGRVI